MEFLMLKIIL